MNDLSIKTGNTDLKIIETLFLSTKKGYGQLSEVVSKIDKEIIITLLARDTKAYPNSLAYCFVHLKDDTNSLLEFKISDRNFIINGDKNAMEKLSSIFLSMTESDLNSHDHIFYYEGNGLVSETNISLVIALISE